MRDFLTVFFILVICFSCRSPKKEPESIHHFLKNKFGYNMAPQDSVTAESYLNDTSNTYIRSFIVINSQRKFPTNVLKNNGFQEFQQNIDTLERNGYSKLTLRYSANEISEKLSGDVLFPVPIDSILIKNLLMNKVKLKVHEYKLIFYDTLSNKFYFYRHEFYKPSIF